MTKTETAALLREIQPFFGGNVALNAAYKRELWQRIERAAIALEMGVEANAQALEAETLTVKEAAEYYKIHPNTLKNRIREGKLPHFRTNGRTGTILLQRDDLNILFRAGLIGSQLHPDDQYAEKIMDGEPPE